MPWIAQRQSAYSRLARDRSGPTTFDTYSFHAERRRRRSARSPRSSAPTVAMWRRWIGVSGGGADAGGLSPTGLSPAGFSSAGLTGSGGDVFRVVDGAWLGGGARSSSFGSRLDGGGVIPELG